ncbi:flagellar assembly protein FlgT [Aestuariibacter halophilus]|uniref:Flagellar assembly protein FlgT n=2 Tax=Fluctibacter halophilus TaxID=226011 RepID=A0ABS8G5C7_9ALTE|nr:flagellar assembly protein FlgT [Aestuariibacter halophilus]
MTLFPAQAAWFEASGHAVIVNGDKEQARRNATEDALRQAMLFAGASVKSVQMLANGLLQDEQLEIRTTGEVNQLELIDEIYHDGMVTVNVRADIFAQKTTCASADYQKRLVTSWFTLRDQRQGALGGIEDIGKALPLQLKQAFRKSAQHVRLTSIDTRYIQHGGTPSEASLMARRMNGQYVLLAQVDDISSQEADTPSWQFWADTPPRRQAAITFSLYDGQQGELLWQQGYATDAPWEFDRYSTVDINSQTLWSSAYGQAVTRMLQTAAQDIDEFLACQPAYGRVLHVTNQTLQIDLGERDGLSVGDELTLFQLRQFYTPGGQLQQQYRLHPHRVRITEVFANTANARAGDDTLLGNIQPNDFVARR